MLKDSRKSKVTGNVEHPSALSLSRLDPAGSPPVFHGNVLHMGLLATTAGAQLESSKVRLVFQPAGAGGEVIVLKSVLNPLGPGQPPVYPQKSVTSILSPAWDRATISVVDWRAGTEEGTARAGTTVINDAATMSKNRIVQRFIRFIVSCHPHHFD